IVNFKNTVIILTSNIGSEYFNDLTINIKGLEEKLKLEMKKYFRPEFINRLDEIIIFNRLDLAQIKKIVDIQIDVLKERLKDKKIEIELTASCREFLADKGFSPEYGARPLKRVIQKLIVDPLSLKVIQREFKEGDKITVDVKNREIVFKK
ncbi:MAG: AAA family ATPase, partial [Candidatus Omnitrophica bacterium]|nr:AAA family ATPase [Candidatus Omnitrophota bacterium]